jgi:hypothetical protein
VPGVQDAGRDRSTTTRYLNIQRRGLHLAIEKLEENQRLMAEERKRKAEELTTKNAESVAHALHTDEQATPAFVSELNLSPAVKQLPS